MHKAVKLKETIEAVIQSFNEENERSGNTEKYSLSLIEQEVQFTSKVKNVKQPKGKAFVGRIIIFRTKDGIKTALHQLAVPIPVTYSDRLTKDWETTLLRQFLFDMIGLSLITMDQMVESRQKAAFDVEKQRPKADEQYEGLEVEVVRSNDNDWFNVGDIYEVFSRGETQWGVYSTLEEHLSNSGIGPIPTNKCKIIKGNRFHEI